MCGSGIAERLQPLESQEEILAKIAIEAGIFHSVEDILKKFDNVHFIPQHHNESGIMSPDIGKAIEIVTMFINNKAKRGATNYAIDIANSAIQVAIQVTLLSKARLLTIRCVSKMKRDKDFKIIMNIKIPFC